MIGGVARSATAAAMFACLFSVVTKLRLSGAGADGAAD